MAILVALIVVAAWPGAFTRFPRDYSDTIRSVETPSGTEWLFAPEAPSSYYPCGTDQYGYDILTRIVWGLRWTLGCVFLVAAARTVIGGTIGGVRALAGRPGGDRGLSPLSGIPSFVIAFFAIYPFSINSPWQGWRLFLFQCAILSLLDLGPIVGATAAKTSALLAAPFVEAASSCGAGNAWKFRRHVMPFLAEELLECFADQTVAVLQLVGRLGVFMLFIGGTTMSFDPLILNSATSEITGLIGLYRIRLLGARWMLVWPLVSYLLVLAGTRTFASGLRERERRRHRLYDAR
jgi:peptide/nickel transport system permease protein